MRQIVKDIHELALNHPNKTRILTHKLFNDKSETTEDVVLFPKPIVIEQDTLFGKTSGGGSGPGFQLFTIYGQRPLIIYGINIRVNAHHGSYQASPRFTLITDGVYYAAQSKIRNAFLAAEQDYRNQTDDMKNEWGLPEGAPSRHWYIQQKGRLLKYESEPYRLHLTDLTTEFLEKVCKAFS